MQAMPVQSAILAPKPGATLTPDASGCIQASGYACSGGGSAVIRVEVTADAGKTWVSAQLQNPGGVQQPSGRAWAWVFWRAAVPVKGLAAGVAAAGQAVDAAAGAGVRADSNANDAGRGLGTEQAGSTSTNSSSGERHEGVDTAGGGGAAAAAGDGGCDKERVVVLQVKAVDERYNSQPGDVGGIWNIRGCGCNSWHTVYVTVKGA